MNKYILLLLLLFLLSVFLYIRYGIRNQADTISSQINQYIDKKLPGIKLKVYDIDEKKTKHYVIEEEDEPNDNNEPHEHFQNKKTRRKKKRKFKQHVKKPTIETFVSSSKNNDKILDHYANNFDTYQTKKDVKKEAFIPYNNEDAGYANQSIQDF